ncbi:TolC family protein, partial [uncultured Thiodictyon sp.]
MRTLRPSLIATLVVAPALMIPGAGRADDLIQIYDLAVQSDPQLRQAEQKLFATMETRPQALAPMLPNVGLQGTVDYNDVSSKSTTQFGSFNNRDNYSTQSGKAVVTQSVYNRANWMTLKQSETIIAQAEAQFRSAEIDLMVRTTQAYFDV